MSRASLGSEPDLIAYDSSSILPTGYSYGIPPPGSSVSTSPELQAVIEAGGVGMSGEYSQRSRTRAASMASRYQSQMGLPMFSPGLTSEREKGSAKQGDRTAGYDDPFAGRDARASSSKDRQRESYESGPDESDEDDEDEAGSDLEMDTLNKNSNGRGGWKMLHHQDKDNPGSPIKGTGRRSTSGSHHRHPSTSSSSHLGEKGPHHSAQTTYSRFEKFDKTEWSVMSTALALVTFLTVVSLYICFAD